MLHLQRTVVKAAVLHHFRTAIYIPSAKGVRRILSQTQKAIGMEGVFITFQYTLLRKTFLENYFNIQKIVRVWRNLPPAYVLLMKLKCCHAKQISADSVV